MSLTFLNEAMDGAFLFLLVFAFGISAPYAALMTTREIRAGTWSPLAWGPEAKGGWSLSMIFLALILRVGPHWAMRHSESHGLHWEAFNSKSQIIILISTLLASWGTVCWIRTITPDHAIAWIGAALLALVFGFGMAF